MPHASERSRRRRPTALLVGAVLIVLVGGGLSVAAVAMTADAGAHLDATMQRASERIAEARARFDELRVARDAAQLVHHDSGGTVLDETARRSLAVALEESAVRELEARAELAGATELLDHAAAADRSVIALGMPLRAAGASLGAQQFSDVERFAESVSDLDDPIAAVAAAVDAWHTEQERILRERYTNHVWTAGWTAELDACRGSVDLSAHYGIAAIAEHWSCGGKDFPDEPGTLITLTGVHAGTYRVEGIVKMLDQRVATIEDLPKGHELVYQTCQDGQPSTMSLTALSRIH